MKRKHRYYVNLLGFSDEPIMMRDRKYQSWIGRAVRVFRTMKTAQRWVRNCKVKGICVDAVISVSTYTKYPWVIRSGDVYWYNGKEMTKLC